jgi:type III secretion system IpaD/SipD/SspD family effector
MIDGITTQTITPDDYKGTGSVNSTTEPPNDVKAADTTIGSGGNIVGTFPGFISGVKKNFIDPYTAILKYYTDFMGEVSDIMAALSKAVGKGDDSNSVSFDESTIRKLISDLTTKYSELPLFTSQGTGAEGKAEAERWAKELGLDISKVSLVDKGNPDGPWKVEMDLSPLEKMTTALKGDKMSTFEYQAMQTAIDAQKAKLQSTVQTVAEKYGRANANMDSLYKMMSAMIVAMEQLLEAFNRTYAE